MFGVEFDFVHLDSYRKFSDALPNAKFVDVSQPDHENAHVEDA